MTCKGIIFDMDGTLLDSMGYWNRIGEYFLAYHKLPKDTDFIEKVSAMGVKELREYVNERYGFHYDKDSFYEDYHEVMEPIYMTMVKPKPYVREFLKYLKGRGIKTCIATATRHSTAEMVLRHLGLMDDIEFMISCSDVGAGKNRPDIYLKSCEMMGLSVSDTVVFEDVPMCVETAKKAGFKVVGVFDEYAPKGDNALVQKLSDRYIVSYDELLPYIKDKKNVSRAV